MMTEPSRDTRILTPTTALSPEIGGWLAALHECRERTIRACVDINAAKLDRAGPGGNNSIGSLLYHIAAIELDWLYSDILEHDFPTDLRQWFPLDVRGPDGTLAVVTGNTVQHHLARLWYVREKLEQTLATMTPEEFDRTRKLESYDVTPRWVVHHLLQHEAEHRGQIISLRRAR
jgi:uncharacterized damage-inducible protein DinB